MSAASAANASGTDPTSRRMPFIVCSHPRRPRRPGVASLPEAGVASLLEAGVASLLEEGLAATAELEVHHRVPPFVTRTLDQQVGHVRSPGARRVLVQARPGFGPGLE